MKTRHSTNTGHLIARRQRAMKKLASLGPVVRGSLVTAKRGNHLAHQLTVSVQGKTHTVYVPPGMVKEVKQWIRNYKQMQAIVRDISKVNMAIIHRFVPENPGVDQRRRSSRPSP
jgi:hypothetical protein